MSTTQTDVDTNKRYVAGGELPPLAILEEGTSLKGILRRVDAFQQEITIKGKTTVEERTYYRFELTERLEAFDADKEAVSYPNGATVTLPGAGHLNWLFRDAAQAFGFSSIQSLVGFPMKVEYRGQEIMKTGPMKGKKCKKYSLVVNP